MSIGRGIRSIGMLAAAGGLVISGTVMVAHADSNTGGGSLVGTVQFAAGQGVPGALQPCGATSWHFDGTAAGVVVDIASAEYAGPVAVRADGGATCALSSAETGSVSVTVDSTLPIGAFHCPPQAGDAALSGIYLRIGAHVVVDVRGSCAVAAKGQGSVEFFATGEFAPTATSDGSPSGQVTKAAFAGGFALDPTLSAQ
jgi:hypothetical protein